MTIPRVPTPGIALIAVLALGLLLLWHVATLPASVAWAAILVFLVAVYVLLARRRFSPHEARVRPPGLPLMALVLVSLAVNAAANFVWSTDLLLAGFVLSFTAALVWIVKIVFAALADGVLAIRSKWQRWLLPPLVGYLGLGVILAGAPFSVRVELSGPALDSTGQTIESGQIRPGQTASLGLFGEGSASLIYEDYVGFDLGQGGFDLSTKAWFSLVWIPSGTDVALLPEGSCLHWTHMRSGWWLLENECRRYPTS
jgi:hypothetical protein